MDAQTRDHPWSRRLQHAGKPRSTLRGSPILLIVTFLASLFFVLVLRPAPLHAQSGEDTMFGKRTELPPWLIKPFGIVVHTEHPGFGWYSAPLGDVNGDGYDDLAVSTSKDTTFLFFGGDTLDPHEDGFVLGGSASIAALDLNGDGRRDLVTTMEPEHTPEERGMVRIYVQMAEPPYFREEPDIVLTGAKNSRLGVSPPTRTGIVVLDYNGDGFQDFCLTVDDDRDSIRGKVILYCGGESLDTSIDGEFRTSHLSRDASYGSGPLAGDINGDGYDDLMIPGRFYDWERGNGNLYWDLYLGNRAATVGTPHRFFDYWDGWSPDQGASGVMDLNADGYADIIDKNVHRIPGDALFCFGSNPLPDPILPTDSIPNRDPGLWGDVAPWGIYPVGDMNGDGTRDLIIAWAVYLIDSPLYLMYPAGGTSFYKPMGYRGLVWTDWFVEVGAYDAGDMNGDGCDDMVVLGQPAGFSEGPHNRFVVFLGAKQMQTSVDGTGSPTPANIDLQVYPNPVRTGQTHIALHLGGLTRETVSIGIHDMLGRERLSRSVEPAATTIDENLSLPDLTAGIYLVRIRQGKRVASIPLTIY